MSVAFIVQSFFVRRIWVLKGGRWPLTPLVIAILTLDISLVDGQVLQRSAFIGWLSLSIICDVLITVTLVVQLRSKQSSDFKFVNHVLHRAARMAIETGGLTSLVAIAELVLYMTSRSYFFALGKVYSNSLLASLNSRAPIFRKDDPADEEVWSVHFNTKSTVPVAGAGAEACSAGSSN
ncbi:hypothetical protein D9615_009653 [Tricholomella constricta]|uniref:DUF6534 domain-containing protein n=1 Tax=Tricholomella constricta TaxID=117010 RepID=A0A8H5GUM5_9AGAR|nr:hypothetical protein D9615_009653 [Tricholomella constricta]